MLFLYKNINTIYIVCQLFIIKIIKTLSVESVFDYLGNLICACAAAKRAIGTLYGEHDT